MKMEGVSSIREELQLPTLHDLNQDENPLMTSQQEVMNKGFAGEDTPQMTELETNIANVPPQTTSLREYSGGYADSTPPESIRNIANRVIDVTGEEALSTKQGDIKPGRKEAGYVEGPDGQKIYVHSKPQTPRGIQGSGSTDNPMGSIDPDSARAAFMDKAIKQIGFNPFTYNPHEEVLKDIQANYNQIVYHVFGANTNPRYLTPEQSDFLQKQLKLYYDMKLGVYGKKGELGKQYLDHMMQNFDKDLPTIHGRFILDKKKNVIGTLPQDAKDIREAQDKELGMRKKIEDLVAKDLKNRFQGKVQYDSLSGEWKIEPGTDPQMVRNAYTDMKKKYYDRYQIKYAPEDFEIPDNSYYTKGEPGNMKDAVKYLDDAKTEAEAKERAGKLAKYWKKEHLKLAIGRSKWR